MADSNTPQGQNQPKPTSPPPPPPVQQPKPVDPKATAKPPKQCFSDGYEDGESSGKKKR